MYDTVPNSTNHVGKKSRTKCLCKLVSVTSVLFVFIVHLSNNVCLSFNLEPRLPIVKIGQTGSHFGYSVAQHLITDNNKTFDAV